MKVKNTSEFNISAEQAWSLVRKSSTLIFVTKGLLSFTNSNQFPEEWNEGKTEVSRLKLFEKIPGWIHHIHFSKISAKKREIITNEHGGIITRWDHRIKVTPIQKNSSCSYTDEIDIQAGLFTPFVWLYANLFYRYRQKRWKLLIRCEKIS